MLSGNSSYPNIFSTVRIGPITAKNRIKFAATETNFNYRDGYVSAKEIGFLEAQARGGAGIVTTQGANVDFLGAGRAYVGMMGIWHDKFIPGLKALNHAIKRNGAVSCLQLMHCGRAGGVELPFCLSPSQVPQKLPNFRPPREMTGADIKKTIEDHVNGARRAAEAGYDIVEICGMVGYLLANFISSYTNKRNDEYGGDIEGRFKIVTEIIRGCKNAVGDNVAVGIRLCAEELLNDRGGNTPEESLESIRLAVEAGCDYISLAAGWHESLVSVVTRDVPMGHWLYLAERVKRNIDVPVTMAYRLFLPDQPEIAIKEGILDIWEMCRPMIADPFLPRKVLEGRQEDIIPCIACNVCLARLFRDTEISCTVRPSLGREDEPEWGFYGFEKDRDRKKVIVVGAGVAGLQAAAVAAEKGHDVTVYEKRAHVGGQMRIAANGPWGDKELMRLVNYLYGRAIKYGAGIKTNKTITPVDLEHEHADILILATGAVPDTKSYPGSDKKHVCSAFNILEGTVKPGKNVVILGGKGIAVATGLYIIEKYPECNV